MTETPASPDPADAPPALHEDDTDPEATGDPVAGDLGPEGDADPSPASPTPSNDEDGSDYADETVDAGTALGDEEPTP